MSAQLLGTNPMSAAPMDGRTILLKFRPMHFVHGRRGLRGCVGSWRATGMKWEECRWIDDKAHTGSDPHWEPWCGTESTRSTEHISPENCIGWLPVPA